MVEPVMARAAMSCAPVHEVKFTCLDLKAVEVDGSFEGYASVFDREDMSRDVVLPGAFADSLRQRGPHGVKMLFQHDANQPIGVWTALKEDARGLYAQGRLMPEVAKAREVHALMRAGALDGLSIGFRTVKGRRDRASGVRRLAKVDLWEISVVTFPLLPEARVATMKARPFDGATPTERDFERWLTRDAGLTRKEARALMGAGFDGLKALRDAGQATPEAQLAARIGARHRIELSLRSRAHAIGERREECPSRCQGDVRRRLVGVFRAPTDRRLGRRLFPPRSVVGVGRYRRDWHRRLLAACRLARGTRATRGARVTGLPITMRQTCAALCRAT